jgi:general secretion pathway protein K
VLWLTAALGAIAFSVATTVRGETERAGTSVDDLRSYYLATGAIQRAILYMQWGPKYYQAGMTEFPFDFPNGVVTVQIIPETSKLNINTAKPEELYRLLLALGTREPQAREITLGIADWRAPAPDGGLTEFDQFYLSLNPTFRPRHTSLEEIEELLSIKGMTPELFYGTYERDAQANPPRLVARGGLRECVSVWTQPGPVDANTAPAAVLAAVGLPPEFVAGILARRPFHGYQELQDFTQAGGPVLSQLRIGGNLMFTLRASARLKRADGRLSDMVRTVSTLIRFSAPGSMSPYMVMRWYDRG